MVGIGGTSMSGIAEIIFNMGYKVTGSDTYQIGASASALVVSNGK